MPAKPGKINGLFFLLLLFFYFTALPPPSLCCGIQIPKDGLFWGH